MLEEVGYLGPRNGLFFTLRFYEAAAFTDIVQLSLVGAGIFTGLPIEEIPDNAGQDADDASDVKDFPPAVIF